jgi:hypothetical protein
VGPKNPQLDPRNIFNCPQLHACEDRDILSLGPTCYERDIHKFSFINIDLKVLILRKEKITSEGIFSSHSELPFAIWTDHKDLEINFSICPIYHEKTI